MVPHIRRMVNTGAIPHALPATHSGHCMLGLCMQQWQREACGWPLITTVMCQCYLRLFSHIVRFPDCIPAKAVLLSACNYANGFPMLLSFHSASAVAAVNSIQWTASSPASCRDCSPPPNFVNGHTLTIWFMVCCWLHTQRSDEARPICVGWKDSGLDLSENDLAGTMIDEVGWILVVG